ncbi:type II toxin-antitoxin system death-on-curing family toxin [Neisseria weixii]|uniref:type II toxin-antitoxin system death-on-curing family toxin n=1 Tax=Neisseria weixii TaxID=1853276 RepID=UPI0018DFF773
MYYNQIENIYEIAARYGIVLAKGHAFVDGNKRTGLATMLTFLEIQGVGIQYDTGLDDLMAEHVAEFLYQLTL